jgi:D-alanyl-D-alanine carboxypeptidase
MFGRFFSAAARRRPTRVTIACVFAALTFSNAWAASAATKPSATAKGVFSPAETKRLNATIEKIVRDHKLPSAAVGVRIPGPRDYAFVTGIANLPTREPRRFSQPFRIASVTKAFTAGAVLQLVERKLLRKTDPLARWYPDFPNAARITVDDLLRMRSGIAAPSDDEVLAAVYDDPLQKAPTLAQLMARSAVLRRNFKAPNTQGVYTDLNYFILGGIIEKVTGSDAGSLIAAGIIRKLNLTETSYPTGVDLRGGLHGYGWNARTRRFEDKTKFNPPLAGTAGAMISSVSDLQTYIRVLCRGGLFTPATQAAMLRGQPLAGSTTRYGEGVISNPGICGHSGTINGFNTDLYYLEKLDAAVVVSVNRLDKDNRPQTTPILSLVLKALEGR